MNISELVLVLSESSGIVTRPCSVPGLDFLLCWSCITLTEMFPASQSNSLAFYHLLKFVPYCNLLNHELKNFFSLGVSNCLMGGVCPFQRFVTASKPCCFCVFVFFLLLGIVESSRFPLESTVSGLLPAFLGWIHCCLEVSVQRFRPQAL